MKKVGADICGPEPLLQPQPHGLELFVRGETTHFFRAASPPRGLFLFFFATVFSFMLALHLSLECQPLSCLNQSHDPVVSTLVKTGAQWRLLSQNFPPWQTVYHHFHQWTRNGLLARLNHRLRTKVQQAVGKHAQPTAASLESQTVRASAHGGEVGYDAAKKTKGRKRFLLVDTLGWLLGVTLEPADCPERKGARTLLATVLADYPERLKLWVDGGFNGPEFAAWCAIMNRPPLPPPAGFTSP